jgi:hypothetical protein
MKMLAAEIIGCYSGGQFLKWFRIAEQAVFMVLAASL